MSVQKALFEKIKPMIPANKSLAEYLGNVLYLSSDSVYRRLRGETQLSIDELKAICEHFGLSADSLIDVNNAGKTFPFRVSAMAKGLTLFDFLMGLKKELTELNNTPGAYSIYSERVIPFFYTLMLPGLFHFKCHLWGQVYDPSPEFLMARNEKNDGNNDLRGLANEVLGLYCKLPSIEIWNSESITGMLYQIEFYKNSRYFSSLQEIFELYDEVDELLLHLEKQAEVGCKFLPGENPAYKPDNYKLYLNQISLVDNLILTKTSVQTKVFIIFGVMNFLTTTEVSFCEEAEEYLTGLVRRSSLISIENIKMRSIFFNDLHERVDRSRKKLL